MSFECGSRAPPPPPPEMVDLRSVFSSFQPLRETPGPVLFVASCTRGTARAVAFADGALCVLERASNTALWDAYMKHQRENKSLVTLPNADGSQIVTDLFVARVSAGRAGAPSREEVSRCLELALTGQAAAALRVAVSPVRVRSGTAPGRSDVTSAAVNRFSSVCLRAGADGDAIRGARYLRDVLTGMPRGNQVCLSKAELACLTPCVAPTNAPELRQSAAGGEPAAGHPQSDVGTDAEVLEGDGPVLLSALLRWVLGSAEEDRTQFLLDDVRGHSVERLSRMLRFLTRWAGEHCVGYRCASSSTSRPPVMPPMQS